ncbi:MAG: type II toxin-antitoxin system VapC family toxin [Actinobacteria bacterium]|nr:type II toxin-antitoxin system VapC family toxin [Actinomycetota bacterium]
MPCVLDSSVVLAWLQQESGSAGVHDALTDGFVTAANWAEILQKARQHGGDPQEVGLLLRSLGLEVVDVTREDGEMAASIWTKDLPLSLGDRLCLAVAARLGLPAMTADTEWQGIAIEGLDVEVIERR